MVGVFSWVFRSYCNRCHVLASQGNVANFAVILVDQIYSDFKQNQSLKNPSKEGTIFIPFTCTSINRDFLPSLSAWHNLTLCDSNPLSLVCLCCLLVFVLLSPPLCDLCTCMYNLLIWHAWIPCCSYLISSSAARLPVPSVCVCPSHPSRAVHPCLSEMSVKIDSSDNMVSEVSTKDPGFSEEKGLKSDDDDNDGDDSNWGGGDRQRDKNTDMRSARKCPGGTHGFSLNYFFEHFVFAEAYSMYNIHV